MLGCQAVGYMAPQILIIYIVYLRVSGATRLIVITPVGDKLPAGMVFHQETYNIMVWSRRCILMFLLASTDRLTNKHKHTD